MLQFCHSKRLKTGLGGSPRTGLEAFMSTASRRNLAINCIEVFVT
jgi:hypothetical protein